MKCYRCKRTARHFIKFYTFAFFNPSGDEKIIVPYCDIHVIGYEHCERTTKDEYELYLNECEIEDILYV